MRKYRKGRSRKNKKLEMLICDDPLMIITATAA